MALNKKQTFTIGNMRIKYDPKSPDVTIMVGKATAIVPYSNLWTIVFAMGDEAKQDQMLPMRIEQMQTFIRQYSVRAAKDIKAGEMVTFNVKVDVPTTVVEGLAEAEKTKELEKTQQALTPGNSSVGATA